jgi:hypothetical protein
MKQILASQLKKGDIFKVVGKRKVLEVDKVIKEINYIIYGRNKNTGKFESIKLYANDKVIILKK